MADVWIVKRMIAGDVVSEVDVTIRDISTEEAIAFGASYLDDEKAFERTESHANRMITHSPVIPIQDPAG